LERPLSPGQVDLHLHAGQERDLPLKDLVKFFIDRGFRFLGLLDHSELYAMGDERLKKKIGRLVYSSSPLGLSQFYSDIDRVAREFRGQVEIFKGLELPEWEISLTDKAVLKGADFLGCHLNTSCHDPEYRHFIHASCGEHLATRANQLLSLCRPMDKPAVLFHPFHRRLAELSRSADQGTIKSSDEIFTEEEIQTFFDRVDVEGLYVELNYGDLRDAERHEVLLRALRRTCRRLKRGGVGFSLGSDYHRTPTELWDPSDTLESLGLGAQDLSILGDLRKGNLN